MLLSLLLRTLQSISISGCKMLYYPSHDLTLLNVWKKCSSCSIRLFILCFAIKSHPHFRLNECICTFQTFPVIEQIFRLGSFTPRFLRLFSVLTRNTKLDRVDIPGGKKCSTLLSSFMFKTSPITFRSNRHSVDLYEFLASSLFFPLLQNYSLLNFMERNTPFRQSLSTLNNYHLPSFVLQLQNSWNNSFVLRFSCVYSSPST